MRRILVTGASGFIGRCLALEFRQRYDLALAVRGPLRNDDPLCDCGAVHPVGDIADADWLSILPDTCAVIHLAGLAHLPDRSRGGNELAFRAVNVEGTLRLASMAAEAGARRFVFVSSIKVLGEATGNRPFTEADVPCPQDHYAKSKLQAERGLREIERATGMQVVILRPPLVYGPGVGANFLRLMRLVARGVPLPFGWVSNRRSLLYVGNLVSALEVCLLHPRAAGHVFHATDGKPVSTGELCIRMARALGVRCHLLPVPVMLLRLVGSLIGQAARMGRLLDSLEVDDSALRTDLGWCPPFSMEQGLAATAAWFGTHK